jgi:heme oxygenase
MTDLSPAARAIVEAFDERYELLGPLEGNWQEVCLAAALTALAVRIKGADSIRQDLLDIVNELEGAQ